ncbi:MAG: YHYH protein [Acidimicrobiales bacterium]|nr:YHYH protein [Acidimicrobiales bacterium]HRW38434.1 YHYH protein [Aquihabitans sp.]
MPRPTTSPHLRAGGRARRAALVVAIGAVLLVGCGSSDPDAASTEASTASVSATSTSDDGAATTTTSSPATTSSGPVDVTHLPVGDGRWTTTPEAGYLYTCRTTFDGGGAQQRGPWFNDDGTTWDATKKGVVDGEVAWDHQFTTEVAGDVRRFVGNDLPDHTTGEFPIGADDDVRAYDANPNSISEQVLSIEVPATPTVADQPTCLRGEVGVTLTGAAIFDAFDAGGRDAVAWEAQDHCQGHPQERGAYHYHSLTTCIADPGTGHSNLLGYAYDGFGIYGLRGEDGEELTDADLDECHGHTHTITWDGEQVEMYHYHATREFPYTVGCFRGTPIQQTLTG